MSVYYDQNGIKVRDSVQSDVDYLKTRLRKDDVTEIMVSHGKSPEEALNDGLKNSVYCFTVTNGNPVLMFGICPRTLASDSAAIWMLSSDDIKKIKIRFVRNCRFFIDMFLRLYPKLDNYAHYRNLISMRWLKFLGAKIDKAKPYGIMGQMFHHFSFERGGYV